MPALRAAIYARVSSSGQRERHTIDNQLRVLPAFVASQGWTLVATFVDDGLSARTGKLDARDGYHKLVAAAKRGEFDVVVVVDIDRLTRTEDMRERAEILGGFQAAGVSIATPSGGALDLRSMLGELYVTLQAVFAAEENRKRTARIRAGRERALLRGRKPCGPTAYGLTYSTTNGTWGVDEVKASALREIYRRIIAGESCDSIAEDFDGRGIPPPKGPWDRHVVWRLASLRHPLGQWCSDRKRGTMVQVPQLVDETTWLAVQRQLQVHGRRGLRRTRHIYLLEGLATCGRCGTPIGVKSPIRAHGTRGPQAAFYWCFSRRDDHGPARCTSIPVRVDELDNRVWSAVSGELASPELVEEIRRRSAARVENRRDWAKDLDGYRAHLARLERVETAVLARFRRGAISDAAMDTELSALGRERETIRAQIETAEAAIAASTTVQVDDPDTWIAALRDLAESATPIDRQRVVRALVPRSGAVLADGRLKMSLLVEPTASMAVSSSRTSSRRPPGHPARPA